jgi:hypothetical protein
MYETREKTMPLIENRDSDAWRDENLKLESAG